jgi:restriction endonuclease S subunit
MSEWKKVKIGDFLIKETQRFLDCDNFKDLEVYGVSNVEGITFTSHKKSLDLSKYIVIKPKYFAYNPYRINVGSIGLTQDGVTGLVSPAYVVFRTDEDKLLPELLLNFLKSKDGLFEIKKHARGTVRQALRYEDLCNIEMIIPPIEKQIEIIELEKKVRTQRQKLDKKNIEQNNYIALLRQQILQDAISGKLTKDWRAENPNIEPAIKLLEKIKVEKEKLIAEKKIKKENPLPKITKEEIPFELPEKWQWCRLGSIFSSTSGGTPSRGDSNFWGNGDINWLKSGELNDGVINFESEEKITKKGLEKSSTFLFPKDTVLIAMYGATAGKLAILDIESTTNQAICGFLKNSFVEYKFLFYFLRSLRQKMVAESWGQAQPNISQTYLKNFLFSLPPLAEQKAIVTKVEKLLAYVSDLEEKIKQNKQDAEILMQTFLAEAFKN